MENKKIIAKLKQTEGYLRVEASGCWDFYNTLDRNYLYADSLHYFGHLGIDIILKNNKVKIDYIDNVDEYIINKIHLKPRDIEEINIEKNNIIILTTKGKFKLIWREKINGE